VRDHLEPALTEHAAKHVKAQAALSITHRVEEKPCSSESPLIERRWDVTYIAPRGSSAEPSAAATHQRSDNGLVEDAKFTTHDCGLCECSCQLPSCFKLPCRHQVAVAHAISTTDPAPVSLALSDFGVSPMWLKAENTDKAKDGTLRALMETETRLPSGRCAPEQTPRITRTERVQYAMNLVCPSVELAAFNDTAYEYFCKQIAFLQRTLSARARKRRVRPELVLPNETAS